MTANKAPVARMTAAQPEPMSMREKMAREMYQRAGERDLRLLGVTRPPFVDWGDRETWLDLADAALDVLLKPTAKMIGAGEERARQGGRMIPGAREEDCFVAMILAIKSGK